MVKKTFLFLSLVLLLTVKSYASQQSGASALTLSPRLRDALIEQIAVEQYSSNLYLTFASYFADNGLDGCEEFFRHSSKEEQEHALKFYNHLLDRQEKVQLKAVNPSAALPSSTLDAFSRLYENEKHVTRSIYNLYTIALEEKDFAAQVFLFDFISLQVQEEKEAQDLVALLSTGPNDPALILIFDNKLHEKSE